MDDCWLWHRAVLRSHALNPNRTTKYCTNLPESPPAAQTLLIPHKKEKPDGHEQLLGGLRMSACMKMPGVLATVYLVLQVTTVSPVEWMVCGRVSVLSGMAVCLCMHSQCARACAHSQKEETAAVPGVWLLQRTIPSLQS